MTQFKMSLIRCHDLIVKCFLRWVVKAFTCQKNSSHYKSLQKYIFIKIQKTETQPQKQIPFIGDFNLSLSGKKDFFFTVMTLFRVVYVEVAFELVQTGGSVFTRYLKLMLFPLSKDPLIGVDFGGISFFISSETNSSCLSTWLKSSFLPSS